MRRVFLALVGAMLALSAQAQSSDPPALNLSLGAPVTGAGGESVRSAFTKTMNAVNNLYNARAAANGIATLGADSRLPAGQLPATSDISGWTSTVPSGGFVQRTFGQRSWDRIAIEDLGGGTDKTPTQNCAAFANPQAKGRTIHLGDGDYQINCTINTTPTDVTQRTMNIVGNGPDRTRIVNTTANLPSISVPPYTSYVRFSNFTLTRTATAVAGGDGIVTGDNTTRFMISDVWSEKNYNGFLLRTTDEGYLQNLKANNNINDGFLFQNADHTNTGQKPQQWQFLGRTYSVINGGYGFRIICDASGLPTNTNTQMVAGDWDGLSSFANGASAFGAFGDAKCPIQDIRLRNFFFGSDNTSGGTVAEMYFDTYGYNHVIGSGIIEESSAGILVTANNVDIHIVGTKISDTGGTAITSGAPRTFIDGISNRAAGVNTTLPPEQRVAVYLSGPDSTIKSSYLRGGTYGVAVAPTAVRAELNSLTIREYTSGKISAQLDTYIRGVAGVADLN